MEENQEIIYSYTFVMSWPGQRGWDFVLKLHFLYMDVNNHMKLGAEESSPEFWLDIPIKPQPLSNFVVPSVSNFKTLQTGGHAFFWL